MSSFYFHLSHKDDPNYFRYFLNGFSGPAATLLKKMHVSANAVSIFRGGLVLISFYAYSRGIPEWYIIGAGLIFVNNFLDSVDGDLARLNNNVSELGEWLEGITGSILGQLYNILGFFIAYGLYKQTGFVEIWYIMYFILFGFIANSILRDFSFHQSSKVDSMKDSFKKDYNEIKQRKYFQKIYFTLMQSEDYFMFFAMIFYYKIEALLGMNPLFLLLIYFCFIYQVRWLSRFVIQIKYFFRKQNSII